MKAAPEPNAARPGAARRGPVARPTAHPTRTEPAFPKPMATVKVRLAMEMASWCAASGSAPKRAARNPTSAKIPTSAPMCRPTGSPTASAARSARGSGARERRPGGRGTPPTASASSAACASAQRLVAIAAPAAPSGGIARSGPASAGRLAPPNTSRRSAGTFSTFATTVATTIGRASPCACR